MAKRIKPKNLLDDVEQDVISNNISSDCSELIHEITQKEINNNERTFTGTLIYNNSKEINSSGK